MRTCCIEGLCWCYQASIALQNLRENSVDGTETGIGGGGGGWERMPSVPVMTFAIMETSCGVPFIYLVEQIFPFALSRSICIAQMSGKYHACERKKKKKTKIHIQGQGL